MSESCGNPPHRESWEIRSSGEGVAQDHKPQTDSHFSKTLSNTLTSDRTENESVTDRVYLPSDLIRFFHVSPENRF